MARTKEFDPKQALSKAVDVFWSNGYENTSLDMLMNAMGVARQSLYDTFGDKRALYLKALKQYRDENNAALRARFAAGKPVKDAFVGLLNAMSRESRKEMERGCLLLSANMERALSDKEVAAILRENEDEVEDIFREALRGAKDRGEIAKEKKSGALARFFVVTIQGMRAMARVSHDREALESVARVALMALD